VVEPLDREAPWTWLRDETSLRAGERSKPSWVCERPRTERSGAWKPRVYVDADRSCRERAETLAAVPPERAEDGMEREGTLKGRRVKEG